MNYLNQARLLLHRWIVPRNSSFQGTQVCLTFNPCGCLPNHSLDWVRTLRPIIQQSVWYFNIANKLNDSADAFTLPNKRLQAVLPYNS